MDATMKGTTKGIAYWTERAENAMVFLADSDDSISEHKYGFAMAQKRAERTRESVLLRIPDGKMEEDAAGKKVYKKYTVDEKRAIAGQHEDVRSAEDAAMLQLLEYEKIKNKRDTSKILISDWWRSYQKAINEGHV